MNIGIYCGSFNPMHVGHIILGDFLVQNNLLDQIWYLVTPHNPLKNKEVLLTFAQRLEMAKEALRNYPKLLVSDFEFHLPQPSYTVNTLCELQKAYSDYKFNLIIGADNWFDFYKWKSYKEILAEFEIYVFSRYGYLQCMHDWTNDCRIKKVSFVQSPIIEISSTIIREMISQNISPQAYLPAEVFNYMKNNKLCI